jgi:bacterioferritin-associated ferredoxin
MTPIEKAIREFCGHHADWWPSTTQVQEMLALAQPCPTCESLARTVMMDQTGYDPRPWVGLTDEEIDNIYEQHHNQYGQSEFLNYERAIEAKLKEKNE